MKLPGYGTSSLSRGEWYFLFFLGTGMRDKKLAGGVCSGGPISDFVQGWAKIALVGHRAHYWNRIAPGIVRSLCGLRSPARFILYPGTWPNCGHCDRMPGAIPTRPTPLAAALREIEQSGFQE